MPEPGHPARDRANPSMWEALRADPTLQFDRRAIELLARDQRRWTRRYLHLPASVASRVVVAVICLLKRLLPFQFAAHATMDRLCVWFLRRFVSPEAVELLVRHFIVETNLLNVIANNSGAGDIPRVELLPTRLAELADGAVIQHDLNVYNLVIDLGGHERTTVLRPRAPAELTCPPWRSRRSTRTGRPAVSSTSISRRPVLHEHPVRVVPHRRGVRARGALTAARRDTTRLPRRAHRGRHVPHLAAGRLDGPAAHGSRCPAGGVRTRRHLRVRPPASTPTPRLRHGHDELAVWSS
jgi:hypothetical protein